MERQIALNSNLALSLLLSYQILLSHGFYFHSEGKSKEILAVELKLLSDMKFPKLGGGMYFCQNSSQLL